MKKLAKSVIVILGITVLSFRSMAAERNENVVKHTENSPWTTFKEVVKAYQTSPGKFLNLSKNAQAEFLSAAEVMKIRLAMSNNEHAEEKLMKIDIAVNIFRFVWESKPEQMEIDFNMEIPPAPVLG